MPPISAPDEPTTRAEALIAATWRVARGFLDDVRNTGNDVVNEVKDTGGDVVDGAQDGANTLNQAKDALEVYNQWKDKVTAWYQWYLDHKQLIIFLFCLLGVIILMCLLQCAFQWLKCWTKGCCLCKDLGVCCFRCSERYGIPCCAWMGTKCFNSGRYVVGKAQTSKVNEKIGNTMSGIDPTYLVRCGADDELKGKDADALHEMRFWVKVKKSAPWLCVPRQWYDRAAINRRREETEEMMLRMYKNSTNEAFKQHFEATNRWLRDQLDGGRTRGRSKSRRTKSKKKKSKDPEKQDSS